MSFFKKIVIEVVILSLYYQDDVNGFTELVLHKNRNITKDDDLPEISETSNLHICKASCIHLNRSIRKYIKFKHY